MGVADQLLTLRGRYGLLALMLHLLAVMDFDEDTGWLSFLRVAPLYYKRPLVSNYPGDA